jgi:hypothetical protein
MPHPSLARQVAGRRVVAVAFRTVVTNRPIARLDAGQLVQIVVAE